MQLAIMAVALVLAVVGLYSVTRGGDWWQVANPYSLGLLAFASLTVRDTADGLIKRRKLRLAILIFLAIVGTVLMLTARLSASAFTKVGITILGIGSLVAVAGACWDLWRSTPKSIAERRSAS